MAASLDGIFEKNVQEKVLNSKIFVVGAGGIGCELLKNLVLTGFHDIEVIDLDTIDVSNLNRQFLFHKQHVGKSKAAVATESALQFNPKAKIKYYHDSVIGPNFNVAFFEKFNVVLNALDNLAARYHVNRMCLAAGVPLIESGTAGYEGQVELIKGGLTSCYECNPKRLPKDFPGCTIRNTPSEPIHCIVWAKHLFNQLFGESDDDQDVSPDAADPELMGEAGTKAMETDSGSEDHVLEARKNTREWAQENQYNPTMLLNKFFKDDIKYLLSMSALWKNRGRKEPVPLDLDNLPDSVAGSSKQQNGTGLKDMTLWSIAECVKVFEDSVQALKKQLEGLGEGQHLVWDKDDKEAMDFVAACANIRCHIFHIQEKTRFEIKSMAGNIIPAIATTNAIIAGVVVLRALRVLTESYKECTSVYLRIQPDLQNRLLVPESQLIPPSETCIICAKPQVVLSCNLNKLTVKELEDVILKKNLNMVAPDVIMRQTSNVLISSEEGETEQNNPKTLKEMGIESGTDLVADDYLQNYKLEISVRHYEAPPDKPEFLIDTLGTELAPKAEEEQAAQKNGNGKDDDDSLILKENADDDDDLILMEEEEESPEILSNKRKISDGDSPVPLKKRAYDISSDDITL